MPVVPDLSLLPQTPVPEPIGDQYCAIGESEAQCLAAKNSKTGNLLAKEAEAVEAQKKCFLDGSELASDLLILQSAHERNGSAATALELHLRLLEAEGGLQSIDRRLQETGAMLNDLEELKKRGVAGPVSHTEIEIKRFELLHRQAEIRSTVDRLNCQLAEAMGVTVEPGRHYWPEVDLQVSPELPDAEQAVAMARANRADLAALRRASYAEGREAVAAARLLLQPLGMGSSSSCGSCLKLLQLCSHNSEADAREDQISIAYRQQQATVESEARQAADLVAARLTQIAITRDRRSAIQTQLESSQRRQQIVASTFESRTILLDSLAADQDLLHDVIEWKLALVKLRQAQGLLAIECGWDAAARCR